MARVPDTAVAPKEIASMGMAPSELGKIMSSLGGNGSPKDPIAQPCPQYLVQKQERYLPRTLMGGTEAVRSAADQLTPMHENETMAVYQSRLRGTTLYNAFAEAVKSQVGKMFMREITLQDVPPDMEDMMQDVDGEGRAISPFAMDLATEGFIDGVSFLFVDMPTLPTGATLADQLNEGATPRWSIYSADDLIFWSSARVNGKRVLTEARLLETEDVVVGGELRQVQRIRRLLRGGLGSTGTLDDGSNDARGGYQLWELQKTDKGEDRFVLIEEGHTTWPDITLAPFYVNRRKFFEGCPPLRTLAELNLEHWISSSEQRYALMYMRFAMLAVTGVSDDKRKITVGPSKVLKLPTGGDAKYVEPTGAAADAGQKDLDAIEKRMGAAGMDLRVENMGKITATGAAIDSAESNAGLKAVAHSLEDTLDQALAWTAMMLGRDPDTAGTTDVYDEFAEFQPQSTDVPQLLAMRTARELSRQTFWAELVRRHVLNEDFDADKEEKLLDAEAPADGALSLIGPTLPLGGPAGAKGEDSKDPKDPKDPKSEPTGRLGGANTPPIGDIPKPPMDQSNQPPKG